MSTPKRQTQKNQSLQELIVISSSPDPVITVKQVIRICWNTGEEKNCLACYLSKGCKAKA